LLGDIESLDVLINNAAIQILNDFKALSITDWSTTMNVNVTAPFLLSQLFASYLTKTNGTVVNIASIHGQLTKKRFVAYASSKSALIGLTKAMAVDCGSKFRTNAICPAAISTPMLMEGFQGNEIKLNELKHFHPTDSIGNPEEVAKLALYISDSDNTFLNGAIFNLDGGISSVLHDPD